jgi:hypothetical protein
MEEEDREKESSRGPIDRSVPHGIIVERAIEDPGFLPADLNTFNRELLEELHRASPPPPPQPPPPPLVVQIPPLDEETVASVRALKRIGAPAWAAPAGMKNKGGKGAQYTPPQETELLLDIMRRSFLLGRHAGKQWLQWLTSVESNQPVDHWTGLFFYKHYCLGLTGLSRYRLVAI